MRGLRERQGVAALLAALSDEQKSYFAFRWPIWARDAQLPTQSDWTNWMLMGGRGAGKTRSGAEWVRALATGDRAFVRKPVGRIALVGETYGDAREVMVEGESGILAVHPMRTRPNWISSRRRIEWDNGAIAQLYSSDDPDALRGPQFGAAWSDELGKWRNVEETWNMLQFGLRLGEFPRQMITTTPRPIALLKKIIADDRTVLSRMSTQENAHALAQGFLERIVGTYANTRLGRQELEGEIIDDRPDALWQRDLLERARIVTSPQLKRVVVAIDPPISGNANSDACGIIVAGLGADDRGYVVRDQTLQAVSPEKWSAIAIALYRHFQADRIVVETNQGGDMAESVLRNCAADIPVRQVKAMRGKWLRAEPVAHLYERGLVSHVGKLPELEDEMCDFGLEGLTSGKSPDRVDALVWALTDLMIDKRPTPRARAL